jgi:hypothetical protein
MWCSVRTRRVYYSNPTVLNCALVDDLDGAATSALPPLILQPSDPPPTAGSRSTSSSSAAVPVPAWMSPLLTQPSVQHPASSRRAADTPIWTSSASSVSRSRPHTHHASLDRAGISSSAIPSSVAVGRSLLSSQLQPYSQAAASAPSQSQVSLASDINALLFALEGGDIDELKQPEPARDATSQTRSLIRALGAKWAAFEIAWPNVPDMPQISDRDERQGTGTGDDIADDDVGMVEEADNADLYD